MIHDPGTLDEMRRGHPAGALVQPRVGLVDGVAHLPLKLGEAELEVVGASLGGVARVVRGLETDESIGGAGSDLDLGRAWLRAVVEAAERYASMIYAEADFVVGSERELGAAALPLESLPRCSAREHADPRCPLRPADPDAPIRWVRGYSLRDRTERLVPAIMTHLYLPSWPAERFALSISTGVAAHTSYEAALVGALCEVVERDALALAWLGRLRLPELPLPAAPGEEVETLLERAARSAVRFHLFDATTDLGIPTVLALQLRPGHPRCAVSMSCATSLDPRVAVRKVLCEATAARFALDDDKPIPTDVRDYTHMTDGARYHGVGDHLDDLAFLLHPGEERLPDGAGSPPLPPGGSDAERLDRLVARLAEHGMDAVAVDLTTDELRDAGLRVVRVVVPQLMPISFTHRARYLGTPRLPAYVARRTGAPFTEADVNPAPLPFA